MDPATTGPDLIEGGLKIPGRQEGILGKVGWRQIENVGPWAITEARGSMTALAPENVIPLPRDGAPDDLLRVRQSLEVFDS